MGSFHGLKWKKVTTTYHVGLVMVWSKSRAIITKVNRYSWECNSMKILKEHLKIPMLSHIEPPLMRMHLKTY